MKIFYIDTSSSYLYSGIVVDGKLLACCKINFEKDLSKFTMFEVDKLFKSSTITPNEIEKIIVVSGPGSFTGIRIGMTLAKIFAWAYKIEITTITSLDAMATSVDSDKLKVPIIDARRGFVYSGIYEKDKIILENCYIKLDSLKDKLKDMNKEYVFITNQDNSKFENVLNYDPDILKIVNKYKTKAAINPHFVEPSYFKLTEAEENLRNTKYDN